MLLAAIIVMASAPAPVMRGAPVSRDDTASFINGTFTTADGTRRYRLFIPARAKGAKAPALIVMLHGCAQDPEDFARGSQFNAIAGPANALVLYPEQPATANAKKCWNWYEPANQGRDKGEAALIAALTRDVVARFHVDAERVYAGGMSAGGAMAVMLGITYPDLFAAVATHSGIAWAGAHDLPSALAAMQGKGPPADSLAAAARSTMGSRARAVPLLVVHGAADKVVNPGASDLIVAEFIALDRAILHINAPLRIDTVRSAVAGYPARIQHYRDRAGTMLIEQWQIDSLGHAFSGGSADGTWTDPHGPNIAAEMLRFFLAHPMARNNR